METNEKSTKDEIITASMELIDHFERSTYSKREAAVMAAIALVIGWVAGVVG